MLLWAGTLGSNLTIAGAPALFVAKNMGEKEDQRKVKLKEFLGMTAALCDRIPYLLLHPGNAGLGYSLCEIGGDMAILTISREYGSGGKGNWQAVAKPWVTIMWIGRGFWTTCAKGKRLGRKGETFR